MANRVQSIFLLRTALVPSVLSFYGKYNDNCEADSLFSGDEAQPWALLESSCLGLACGYVIICVQLCMHVAF